MGLAESMRKKLQVKVFASGKLGSNATLYVQTSASVDEYDSEINVAETSSTIRIVPYNLFAGKLVYDKFGDISEGETDCVVPYGTNVSVKSKITFNSVDYEVKDKEDYVVDDNNIVAIALRLAKIQTIA